MPRIGTLLVFLSIALSITGSMHYYIWARLIRDTALAPPFRQIATGLIIALYIGIPATLILGRQLPPSVARYLALPIYVWMGMMFLLACVILASDVIHAIGALSGAIEPERRLFFRRVLSSAAALTAGGLGLYSLREALGQVRVKKTEVKLARLPRGLDGFRIVQMSDIHIGPTLGRGFMQGLVDRCNSLDADLIVITGDLVDGSVENLRDAVAPVGNLKAKHGVYFITGNHEYYSGADAWIAELRRLGVHVLRNERVSIGDGANSFDLAGIDDFHGEGTPGHGPDLPRAVAGRDPSRELVLLAHQPKAVAEASQHGVGLQLSGHTHGGQIWPFTFLVKLQQPYVAGWAKHGDTQLYVSRGTGFWGPPMRLGAPSEITHITLRAPA